MCTLHCTCACMTSRILDTNTSFVHLLKFYVLYALAYAHFYVVVPVLSKPTCIRVRMVQDLSTSAGVPLADILVYDVQATSINGHDCLTASLWITGENGTFIGS